MNLSVVLVVLVASVIAVVASKPALDAQRVDIIQSPWDLWKNELQSKGKRSTSGDSNFTPVTPQELSK